ncbi:MAG: 30S ribosomal protein S14, partial [Chloroflexi bacterium]|nr:30S ribosomal protein S14 [Chloroflexota bacterium]
MAKKSAVQKNLKRQRTVKKYAEKRNSLLAIT